MATGIIGVLAGAGTLSYTPLSSAKVKITYCGTGYCQINGANVINTGAANALSTVEVFVGASQTLTITAVPQSSGALIVSALES